MRTNWKEGERKLLIFGNLLLKDNCQLNVY